MLGKWRIFFFSLVPLCLAFAGVIGGSIHGHGGSLAEIFPTPGPPPPAASSSASAPGAPAPAGASVLQLTAKNLSYDKRTLSVTAGAPVTVQFDNEDAGVSHNFAVYTNNKATTKIFAGDLLTGPATTSYTFTAPTTPGNYYFRCDVHPDQMNGTFTVK